MGALIIVYILCYLLLFLISVLIARWIFKINDIVDYQHKQYLLLRQIAYKLGVEEKHIAEIDNPELIRKANVKIPLPDVHD